MKILFSGGGTLGPVTPLLAMKEMITEAYPDAQFVWIGTADGPERELVERNNIQFNTIAAGKLRRYASLGNIVDIYHITAGFFQALRIIKKEKPDLCISAGGFVSVPVHLAASIRGIPTWIHQQDIRPGLANKLMAPVARIITTATESSLRYFSQAVWLGNPVRSALLSVNDRKKAQSRFGLSGQLPVIFVTGGGTGSQRINELVVESLPFLQGRAEIIHLTGKDRSQVSVQKAEQQYAGYHPYQFFTDEMRDAYAAADIVVSRGGFGTSAELAALKKPTIFIPIPGHQTDNVLFFEKSGAAIVFDQERSGKDFSEVLIGLLDNANKRNVIGEQLHRMLPIAKKDEIIHLVKTVIG